MSLNSVLQYEAPSEEKKKPSICVDLDFIKVRRRRQKRGSVLMWRRRKMKKEERASLFYSPSLWCILERKQRRRGRKRAVELFSLDSNGRACRSLLWSL